MKDNKWPGKRTVGIDDVVAKPSEDRVDPIICGIKIAESKVGEIA